MRKLKICLSLSLGLLLFLSLPFNAGSQTRDQIETIKGSWVGKLKIQVMELTVVFNVSANASDSITVTMDSPDQGAKGIATSKVVVTSDSIIIKVKAVSGTYKGAFDPAYTTLTGTWKQGGMALPLELKHQAYTPARNRPQEPTPPYPYFAEEVTFKNLKAGIELSGTLTRPSKEGRYPFVVLISGSGPQNRDEELMGHKPFMVLADYLTRKGIAVLRYDDRGNGKSGGAFNTATSRDFADDVSAAVDFLNLRSDVDTTKIGLIGHSEGGLIAPMVAADRKDVAFVILMAGPGLRGDEIILMQTELMLRANGTSEKDIKEVLKQDKKIFAILKKEADNEKAAEKIRKVLEEGLKVADMDKQEDASLNTITNSKNLTTPWFRFFLLYNPAPTLARVKCPLLAINGEKDLQVPYKENLEAIESAMIVGGNPNYTTEMIPGLNHLFQTSQTGSPLEYSKIEETIAPVALDIINNWIQTQVKH